MSKKNVELHRKYHIEGTDRTDYNQWLADFGAAIAENPHDPTHVYNTMNAFLIGFKQL